MKKSSIFLIQFIVVIFTPFLSAMEEANDANGLVTLNDYLRYAALNNAGLKASFEQWNAAREQIPQAKSLPDPQLSYGYATEPTPQRNMFDVMQMFPWFGTLEIRQDAASAAANAARQEYEARRLELFYQVKEAFYEYSYLKRSVEITGQNLELVRRFEQVVRIRYAASAASHPDMLRAQIELARLDNDLKSLEKLRPALVAELNSILNRPPSAGLPWPQTPLYENVSIDSQTLMTLIARNNPELKASDYKIEAAAKNESLAKKKFYPEIGVGLGIDSGMGRDGRDRVMPKVFFTIPVWRDNYKAAQRQTQAQLRQTSQEKIQLKNSLAAKAEQVLYEFGNSNREIQLYRDVLIPKAQELLAASETAYQSGTIDFLSLIDAQRTLLEYQLYYERVVSNNAQKLAEIEMLCGTQLSTTAMGQ